MLPILALILTLLFIGFLFIRDSKQGYKPSLALSIPCVWILILGSRSVTEWISLGAPISGGDIAEGSPLDRAVFFFLMASGLVVLVKRRISWSQVFRNNIALTIFVLYCGISIVWSDFPFVAFKRWFKGFGDPIMVLIILTDRDPLRAAETVLRICANILIPLSVLFIKYYPHLGRTYSEWTGAATFTGVTTNKNLLGFMLMVCGLSLVWRLYSRWGAESGNKMDNIGIPILLLCMVGWLFQMADSKTSLMGFILGVLIFSVLGLRTARVHVTAYLLACILFFVVLESSFNVTAAIIEASGRDATLTGRTELWEVVLQMQQHPVLGFGFESFWLGDRLKILQGMWYFRPTQAHSGYIEMYLNLGWVGLLFFAGVIVSCYMKSRAMLTSSQEMAEWVIFGRLSMAFLGTYLVYNYTEAAFKTPHFLFVIFLLFAIKYAQPHQMIAQSSSHGFSDGAGKVPRIAGIRNMFSAH
jgi:exopolysaccharide production protein ExoQ